MWSALQTLRKAVARFGYGKWAKTLFLDIDCRWESATHPARNRAPSGQSNANDYTLSKVYSHTGFGHLLKHLV